MTSSGSLPPKNFKDNRELLLHSGPTVASGAFDHFGWQLRISDEKQSWTSQVASIHETCHADLNQSTAYGMLLVCQAYLAKESGDEEHSRKLTSLTELAKRCHEIYATSMSLMISADAGVSRSQFVETYPDYEVYLKLGDTLVMGLRSRFTRMAALTAVIKGCFQTPLVQLVAARGLSGFKISEHSAGEFPDARLSKIASGLDSPFWSNALDTFIAPIADSSGGRLLRGAEAADSFDSTQDQMLASTEFETLSVDLSLHFEQMISDLFARQGLQTLASSTYMEYCQPLLGQCDAAHPFSMATHPLRLPSSERGSDIEALGSQLEETLETGLRIPAQVAVFDDLSRTEWDNYISNVEGQGVIYIASRTKERFAQQYLLNEVAQANLDRIGAEFIVYMVKSVVQNGAPAVRVCLFTIPNQITVVDRILKRGMLAITSMLLLSVKDWQDHWHASIARCATHTILFDLSPLDHLESSLKRLFERIEYRLFKVQIRQKEIICLVFVGVNPEIMSIFCAPCSEPVANGIIHYIRSNLSGSGIDTKVWVQDGPNLITVNPAVELMIKGLLTQERLFDFKALQSQFGTESFNEDRFI